MDTQNLEAEVQKLHKELEAQRNTLSNVISLLLNLSTAVTEGFEKVNERLSALEGKQGMQGVNTQLADIKNELHKIQKTYPYDEMYNNITSIKIGEA